MKKWLVRLETGYCGSDVCEVIEFPKGMSEDEIEREAEILAYDNASQYGYEMCHEGEDCEDDDCDMEHPSSTGICAIVEPYDHELHKDLV